jgi:hypothetical protein
MWYSLHDDGRIRCRLLRESGWVPMCSDAEGCRCDKREASVGHTIPSHVVVFRPTLHGAAFARA